MTVMEHTHQGSIPLDLRDRARDSLGSAEHGDDAQKLEALEGLLSDLSAELEGHKGQASSARQ